MGRRKYVTRQYSIVVVGVKLKHYIAAAMCQEKRKGKGAIWKTGRWDG